LGKEMKPISIGEAVRRLLKIRKRPSHFAGGWRMDESEVEEIKTELRKDWKEWEL